VAWTGLTETAAKAASRPVRVIKEALAANGRALAVGAPEGHYKLILDPGTSEILGGGGVGQDADWAISVISAAVALRLRPADLALGVVPHPAFAESLAALGLR
jgi:dihydrolipoamide dehydrogenase